MKMVLWFTHDVFLASRICMPLNLSCDVVTAQNDGLDTKKIRVDNRVETRSFWFLAGASKEVDLLQEDLDLNHLISSQTASQRRVPHQRRMIDLTFE